MASSVRQEWVIPLDPPGQTAGVDAIVLRLESERVGAVMFFRDNATNQDFGRVHMTPMDTSNLFIALQECMREVGVAVGKAKARRKK